MGREVPVLLALLVTVDAYAQWPHAALDYVPPAEPVVGRPLSFVVRLEAEREGEYLRVLDPALWWRRAGDGTAFRRQSLERREQGVYATVLRGTAVTGDLEYWIEFEVKLGANGVRKTLYWQEYSRKNPCVQRAQLPLTIEHAVPPEAVVGSGTPISVDVKTAMAASGTPKVLGAALLWRRRGQAAPPTSQPMAGSGLGKYETIIPAQSSVGDVEYWFEVAWDWTDAPLGTLSPLLYAGHSGNHPVMLRVVRRPVPDDWYRQYAE